MKKIIILTLCLLSDLIILKINTFSEIYIVSLIIDILSIICICSLIYLFKNNRKLSVTVLIISTVYCISQNIYYLFFNSFYSLMNMANALDLSGIKMNLVSKLNPSLMLYLLPVFIYLIYLKYDERKTVP
ncbi:MAG: hypothetical protein ACI4WM_03505, partial [Erysipelotrichaceae bacterium]